MTGVFAYLVLRFQPPPTEALAPLPTETEITLSPTASLSPSPSATPAPSVTAAPSATPLPTATPQPPRGHTIAAGDTFFGLSLLYGVTMESILEANGMAPNSQLNVAGQLLIPWPTATPPLVPVTVEVNGEVILADPAECQWHTIEPGDTLIAISVRFGVELDALLAVNRLTQQSWMQPGDPLCIPKIIRGQLPATPGPSPTPTNTPPPAGPQLLFPVEAAHIEPPEGPVIVQWAAVKDLVPNEWYMVEITDLSTVDSHPWRGFTRQTSFLLPGGWRPDEPEEHIMRWRVQIVRVVGQRQDGSFIYTFGGASSQDGHFTWLGAVPTPTPTPTLTPSPTPSPAADS
ncbi:MAG: LysM peptidoglycan-binding domain-containing protein [Candidatus Promineifilaceae bacterium]